MSLEKPKTPPEKVFSNYGVVYEIIPGSEDIPDTETTFGGPHYTRNGLGRCASPWGYYDLFTPTLCYITEEEAEVWDYPSTIHSTFRSYSANQILFIWRFARKEPTSYWLFDVSLVIISVGDLLPACGQR